MASLFVLTVSLVLIGSPIFLITAFPSKKLIAQPSVYIQKTTTFDSGSKFWILNPFDLLQVLSWNSGMVKW